MLTQRNASYTLVEHKYFETIVIILILLSSTTLALEDVYLRERKWLQDILVYVDQSFTTIFFLEMLLKWLAYGFRSYFADGWCWLDFLIVMVSRRRFFCSVFGFLPVHELRFKLKSL